MNISGDSCRDWQLHIQCNKQAQNGSGMANFSHVSFVVSINNQKKNKMKDHVEVYWFLMEISGSKRAFMSTNWWRKSFRNVDRIPCKELFCFDWQKANFQSTCLSSVSPPDLAVSFKFQDYFNDAIKSYYYEMTKPNSSISADEERAFSSKSNWVIF